MFIHSTGKRLKIRNPVVTIGTFDGVHLGHRAVIDELKEKAVSISGEPVVLTFNAHPRQILAGNNSAFSLLTTIEEKRSLLEKFGVEHLVVLDFDKDLSMMGACDFVAKILVEMIGARHLVVGFNHRFGRSGEGDFETVKQCASQYGITVGKVGAVIAGSGTVSSSAIRDALSTGKLENANSMLGYDYRFTGRIVEGRKIGREIGFPTANIQLSDKAKLIPANGVYAVEIIRNDEIYRGMMNIGLNPTIVRDSASRTIEVNIFDFDGDIYGEEITVIFRYRLRDEKTFSSLEELTRQIILDRNKTISLLG